MNTFDQIINEIARIDCGRVDGLHVLLSPRAMRLLTIGEWTRLKQNRIVTSCVYHADPSLLFAIIEPRSKQLQSS